MEDEDDTEKKNKDLNQLIPFYCSLTDIIINVSCIVFHILWLYDLYIICDIGQIIRNCSTKVSNNSIPQAEQIAVTVI